MSVVGFIPQNVYRNVNASFPNYGRAGSAHFLTKQEFDFIANETSYNVLIDEAARYLGSSKEQVENEVNIFRDSVNRAPDTFRVPDDNGDMFYKKMNLGLYLANRGGAGKEAVTKNLSNRITNVAAWISNAILGDNRFTFGTAARAGGGGGITAANLLGNITGAGITMERLAADIGAIQTSILNNTYPSAIPDYLTWIFRDDFVLTAQGNPGNLANGVWDTEFPQVAGRPGYLGGMPSRPNLDLLKIFAMNVIPLVRTGTNAAYVATIGNVSGVQKEAPPGYNRGPNPDPSTATIYEVLFNIGMRLQKDAYFRENNFKNILQEVGMSVDDFARLVENSVTTIYWPDCVASKNSEEDIRYLIKGLGLDDPGLVGKNKMELCSFILTSIGFQADDFTNRNFNIMARLGNENVTNLKRIISMMRKPGAAAAPAGYLGLGANLAIPAGDQAITEGAFLMTGYTAHNITMDKATSWLRATNVSNETQVTFKQYSDNQNIFDLISTRQGSAKPIGGRMDYTREAIANRMTVTDSTGGKYSVLGRV